MVQRLANAAVHTAPSGLCCFSDCDQAAHVTRVDAATSRRRRSEHAQHYRFLLDASRKCKHFTRILELQADARHCSTASKKRSRNFCNSSHKT